MATLSACSYKFQPNWKRVVFFCDVKGIFPIETVVFERFLCLDFDASSASVILSTLNEAHPSLISTIELCVADYICRFHEPTLSPTCAGTQAIKIRQSRTGRARKGSRDHRTKFQDFEEISEQTGLLDLEILFIRELGPKLYKRSDSVGAKLFT